MAGRGSRESCGVRRDLRWLPEFASESGSGTLQNIPGQELQATYNAPNAVVAPVLGRNLSGNAANIAVNLLPPLSQYASRVNQLDLRIVEEQGAADRVRQRHRMVVHRQHDADGNRES